MATTAQARVTHSPGLQSSASNSPQKTPLAQRVGIVRTRRGKAATARPNAAPHRSLVRSIAPPPRRTASPRTASPGQSLTSSLSLGEPRRCHASRLVHGAIPLQAVSTQKSKARARRLGSTPAARAPPLGSRTTRSPTARRAAPLFFGVGSHSVTDAFFVYSHFPGRSNARLFQKLPRGGLTAADRSSAAARGQLHLTRCG